MTESPGDSWTRSERIAAVALIPAAAVVVLMLAKSTGAVVLGLLFVAISGATAWAALQARPGWERRLYWGFCILLGVASLNRLDRLQQQHEHCLCALFVDIVEQYNGTHDDNAADDYPDVDSADTGRTSTPPRRTNHQRVKVRRILRRRTPSGQPIHLLVIRRAHDHDGLNVLHLELSRCG